MAKVVFEYKDKNGRTHKVDRIQDVPRQYLRTMVASGVEDEASSAALAAPSRPPSARALPGGVPPAAFVVAAAALASWRLRGFIPRVIIALATLFSLFYLGFDWFTRTDYAKTDQQVVDDKIVADGWKREEKRKREALGTGDDAR